MLHAQRLLGGGHCTRLDTTTHRKRVWKANWSYGDGGSLFTGSTGTVNHTYNAPLAGGYSVQLSVYCLDGTVINVTRWLCVGGCVPGGIVPNTGTCN